MAKKEAKRREEEMKANLGKSDKNNNAYTLPVQAQVPTVQEILNNSQTG